MSLLANNPLLLLFAVAAVGYLVGRIKVRGFSLGVAAVLFVGLLAGALSPKLELPEIIQSFGLVLFVYTVGLSSGPGFFASFRKRGLRENAFALVVILVACGLTAAVAAAMHLRGPYAAGLFAGALTNTPALASVIESLKTSAGAAGQGASVEPVVAYSVAYPIGVMGVIGAIYALSRAFHVDYKNEPLGRRYASAASRPIENLTVRIKRPGLAGASAVELARDAGFSILLGRVKHGSVTTLVKPSTWFEVGDLVTVIGTAEDVRAAAELLGEPCDDRVDLDRHELDFRRIFVSNSDVTGRTLAELGLPQRFGAIVTRIRRGDVELLPGAATELELGDRVRVLAPRARIEVVTKFFGDSYKALSEIDVITFGAGIAIGLLLGAIPIPLPGGSSFKLGNAGGPLIGGLVLGRLGRTGRFVWSMPYSANLTLRQLGLVLFLAGIGTRSGDAFLSTIREGSGLGMLVAGALVTCVMAVLCLVIGHKVLKIPMGFLSGMLAGIHTQPAALAFASEQADSDLPNQGYAAVYPLATLLKILLAQVLLAAFK